MKNKIFVGVDVSKKHLDIHCSNGNKFRKANSKPGFKQIITKLKKELIELVVLESTGGYEHAFVDALHDEDIPVSVVNPQHSASFAKSLGKKAKSDLLDAEMLCLFAERMQPRRTLPLSKEEKELKSLILRRKQLSDTLVSEKNRLKAPTLTREVKESVEEVIAFIKKQIKLLDKQIGRRIKDNDDFAKKDKLLKSANGVGRVFSYTLIGLLPELGTIDRKQKAALVGVAPFNHDSGNKFGKRSIYGGRECVRSVLYMATITAIRTNKCIKKFYIELRKKGKEGKVAITACMRKLLIALNSMIRDNVEWSDSKYLLQKS